MPSNGPGLGPNPRLISDSDTVDDPDVVAESADASEPRKEAEDSSADTPAAPSVDPDIKARIFADGAVAVFNETAFVPARHRRCRCTVE